MKKETFDNPSTYGYSNPDYYYTVLDEHPSSPDANYQPQITIRGGMGDFISRLRQALMSHYDADIAVCLADYRNFGEQAYTIHVTVNPNEDEQEQYSETLVLYRTYLY